MIDSLLVQGFNCCLFSVPAIIEYEDLEPNGMIIANPQLTSLNSNDKRAKFSAQDLLKQVEKDLMKNDFEIFPITAKRLS